MEQTFDFQDRCIAISYLFNGPIGAAYIEKENGLRWVPSNEPFLIFPHIQENIYLVHLPGPLASLLWIMSKSPHSHFCVVHNHKI